LDQLAQVQQEVAALLRPAPESAKADPDNRVEASPGV
jgi:hypothetical protein